MANYFMLECFEPPDWDDSALVKAPATRIVPRGETWSMGCRFSIPPNEPIELEMMDTHNDQLTELRVADPTLMTRRLVEALRLAGVDNLDTFATIIRHPVTGFETQDYLAVNIIGIVQAADMDTSNVIGGSSDGLMDVDFDGVAIDPEKAKGLLMFRLAESTNGIVIHEVVRDSLLAQGFEMLEFMDPSEWIG